MIQGVGTEMRPNGVYITTVKVSGDGETRFVYEVVCDACELAEMERTGKATAPHIAQVEHRGEAERAADEHVCENR